MAFIEKTRDSIEADSEFCIVVPAGVKGPVSIYDTELGGKPIELKDIKRHFSEHQEIEFDYSQEE